MQDERTERTVRIDAHQHFWQFDPDRDQWMDPQTMQSIRRDFLPPDLITIMEDVGVTHTVAVQADQSDAETDFLMSLAAQYDWISGVVGWIDLLDPVLEDQLSRQDGKLVGYRHVLQGEPDGFMLDPQFLSGIRQLGRQGYTYDILVYARQLPQVSALVSACADQPLIIDHLAKPEIKHQKIDEWKVIMSDLSTSSSIYCKVSGMVTEADWQSWSYDDLAPYLDHVFTMFGEDRCTFGSDWPVCTLAGSYQAVHGVLKTFIDRQGINEAKVMGENAVRFYGLEI